MIPNRLAQKMQFFIEGELPDLNTELNAAKAHWIYYRDQKAGWTLFTKNAVKKQSNGLSFELPVEITMIWVLKDKRKDPDNIAFAKKYILDGMKEAGIIKNDSLKYIHRLSDYFVLASKFNLKPGVIINIEPTPFKKIDEILREHIPCLNETI
jgi:Holliday junction resolvase RusA-like endonuclease